MKIKTLSSAIAAALYSLGAAQAVSAAGQEQAVLKSIDLSLPAYQEYKAQYQKSQVLENNGANIQLQNASNSQKFVREEGLSGAHKYFVRLKDMPAAVYDGGIEGLDSTRDLLKSGVKARGNQTLNAYTSHLKTKQEALVTQAAAKGVSLRVLESFQIALNAVTAELTQDEAEALAQLPNVAGIERVRTYELHTDVGPEHVGAGKVWTGITALGGQYMGEGIVAGILDTGVNTDHPSFAATGDDEYTVQNPLGEGVYLHDCAVSGQEDLCNSKLIGVWSHPTITDTYQGPETCTWRGCVPGPQIRQANGEDYNGHGSHTASTVAGNVLYNAPYSLPELAEISDGIDTGYDFEMISGVAPHANIISYQVCYPEAGCPGDALVAGIEQAIQDGVDVINYSISGGVDPWNEATELAFLAAREAGISVAASAGNAGPTLQTVNHTSPWLTSVAATTHGREMAVETAVSHAGFIDPSLGSEVPGWSETGLVGGSLNGEEITGVVVWAKDYEDAEGVKDNSGYCTTPYAPGTFDFYKDGTPITDPATGGTAANGDVNVFVICQRHHPNDPNANARTAKVANVKAGGADGFILYNQDRTQGAVAEAYELPSVHFTNSQWVGTWPNYGLMRWVDSTTERGHMITLSPATVERRIDPEAADQMAEFSSRGPSVIPENREVMSPSISAPGVAIYAAYADEHPFSGAASGDYATLQGTSMSAPHVAGGLALMTQAHPDWTPAEIQSALQLTAVPDVWDPARNGKANTWATGSGRMDVAAAIDAQLIMDVPVEQYLDANPANGGNAGALNTPYMIDMNCRLSCTWVRTVEATVDGTWNISTETGEASVQLSASPATFTLQAGQKQSIVFTGKWVDSQSIIGVPYGLSVFGAVNFENAAAPGKTVARMPVEMNLAAGDLPTDINITAHRDADKYTLSGVQVKDAPQLTGRVFEKVAPTFETIEVNQRASGNGSNLFEVTSDAEDPTVHMSWVSVPENAVRLIAEVVENLHSDETRESNRYGQLGLYVGIDLNGDGVPQFDTEAVCKSVLNSGEGKDWCNINYPQAGNYWIAWQNHATYSGAYVDDFKVATGVVTADQSTDLSLSLPSSAEAGEAFDLSIHWQDLNLAKGEFFYSAFDLGNSPMNAGNLGMVPFKVTRGANDVDIETSQTRARSGEVIDVAVKVQPNLGGYDRSFELASVLPEGLTLVSGSVSTNQSQYHGNVVETENGFAVTGVQPSSVDWKPEYVITNSLQDSMCRAPDVGIGDGGYVDLKQAGIYPSSFFSENFTQGVAPFPFSWVWPDFGNYSFYMNTEAPGLATDTIYVHPNGAIDLNGIMTRGSGANTWFGEQNPYIWGTPMQVVGGLWYGAPGRILGALYNPSANDEENSGTTVAFTENHLFIEWDRIGRIDPATMTAMDDSYDVEFILSRGYDHSDNAYEMYLAYDNLNWGSQVTGPFSVGDLASAGVRGLKSPSTAIGGFGKWGDLSTAIGNGNLPSVLNDNQVFCFDYRGPETSAFDVTFQVRVNSKATGTVQTIDVANAVDGLDTLQVTADIHVASNITLGEIADQQVNEDEVLTGIEVLYADDDNGTNVITVSGDNVSAEVHGGDSGSTFDLIPAENFNGTTEVTVTVADATFPNDAVSTTFMLTVAGVQDAPVAAVAGDVTITEGDSAMLDASMSTDADGDALSFSWAGPGTIQGADTAAPTVTGLAEGEYTFTVSVSDGVETSEASVMVTVMAPVSSSSSSSGGAASSSSSSSSSSGGSTSSSSSSSSSGGSSSSSSSGGETVVEPEPVKKKKKGGSVYYLLALLAAAGLIRRRKVTLH
ncbi:S8 family serine peptidase [Microbulbifer sp. SA54]|uniref:S8 family serine peptidase n=1 Tax=Microbulbifer sp. SA54 TaxID=3401577 RepID=UPI003AAA9354